MTFYIVLFQPVCIAAHDKLLRATHFAYIALSKIGSELRFFRRSLRSLPPPLTRLLAVNTHRVFTNRSRPRYQARVLRPSEP